MVVVVVIALQCYLINESSSVYVCPTNIILAETKFTNWKKYIF